jgi:O-acetyl-ADP-ribose deacetylase (regulator of RNase III)
VRWCFLWCRLPCAGTRGHQQDERTCEYVRATFRLPICAHRKQAPYHRDQRQVLGQVGTLVVGERGGGCEIADVVGCGVRSAAGGASAGAGLNPKHRVAYHHVVRPLTYLTGDATNPPGDGNKIIAHICNDIGGWGKGFVVAVSRRWPEPERAYRRWFREGVAGGFALGEVRLVPVTPTIWVANMIAQHGIGPGPDGPPIRYAAVEQCLDAVAGAAAERAASVHLPRIGCGLAGGTWDRIEPILVRTLAERDIATTVYDLS